MNPVIEDMKDRLVSEGVGTFATDIFVSQMPDAPNDCVSLHGSGGFSPDRNDLYRPSFMIQIRAETYLIGYLKSEEVRDALHEVVNTTINSTRYIQILMSGDINDIGKDERERFLFTINFDCLRTPT